MARVTMHFIQSLARGLSVLQAFSAERPEMTLTQLARVTGLNLAAAQRFTDTLLQLGFLQRDEHKRFYLGPRVLTLGFSYLNGSALRRQAEKLISGFGTRLNRTVNLSVLDQDELIFVYRWEQQRFLMYDLHAGSRIPAHCTASGKLLLAALPDRELTGRIKSMRLPRFTRHTITDPERLWEEIGNIRRRGYSICHQELSLDLCSVSAPVLDQAGRAQAAVNVSLRAEEAHGDFLDRIIAQLMDLGRDISQAMGYSGDYPLLSLGGPALGKA